MNEFLQHRLIQAEKREKFIQDFFDCYINDVLESQSAQKKFFSKIPKKKLKNCDEFEQFVETLRMSMEERQTSKRQLLKKFKKDVVNKMLASLKKADYSKDIVDYTSGCDITRDTLLDHLNKSKKIKEKFIKSFNKGIRENNNSKLSDQDCFLGCRNYSNSVRKIRRILMRFGKDLANLHSLAMKKEKNSSIFFTAAMNDFQLFVKKNIGTLEAEGFNKSMKALQVVREKFEKLDFFQF
jgi:hypothetical protein